MSVLLRPILRVASRRFASSVGSNPQGVQDDPSNVADVVPDFTYPQGLQGDIAGGNANDAICNLWLQRCKLYGYNDCEQRLQKLLDVDGIPKK